MVALKTLENQKESILQCALKLIVGWLNAL